MVNKIGIQEALTGMITLWNGCI